MKETLFYSFVFIYVLGLIYLAITLPIGPNEAKVYYTDSGILHYFTHLFKGWFGNGLEFRLPFLFFALLNIALFFIMSQHYFIKVEKSYFATSVFMLLPGIITSAVLVNIAVVVISLVLAFIIFYEKKRVVCQALMMLLLLFVHDASVIFFVGVTLFSAFTRNKKLFTISIAFLAVNLLYLNNLSIEGRPQGEFLELFGLYIALFSPLVFIYFFYALYRIWLREKKDILWYVSFTAFVLSILLSLRQQVDMTDFAPYVIVSVVLMLVLYHQTVEVRLPRFQVWYRRVFVLIVSSLILSAMIIFFHQLFFFLLKDKTKHFTYAFYEPYWQMQELNEIGQDCYTVSSQKVQYQLKYYGIDKCEDLDVPKIHR